MILSQRIEQARGQAEAALRIIDEASEKVFHNEVSKDALGMAVSPSVISAIKARVKKQESDIGSLLAQYDSLITTMSQEPLAGTVPGVRVYQMMEHRESLHGDTKDDAVRYLTSFNDNKMTEERL